VLVLHGGIGDGSWTLDELKQVVRPLKWVEQRTADFVQPALSHTRFCGGGGLHCCLYGVVSLFPTAPRVVFCDATRFGPLARRI
jgi:hypothetical protein